MSNQQYKEKEHTLIDFGFKSIPFGEKQRKVDSVFNAVASRYDLMNDLMSFGLHRRWKHDFVSLLPVPSTMGYTHLDLASGTGDIVNTLLKRSEHPMQITLCDINASMLKVAQERLGSKSNLSYVVSNAESLPLQDNTYDSCTMAFGIRNVTRRGAALKEINRVLRPGGKFLCLEFSHVDLPIFDRVYQLYSFNAIPKLGKLLAKDAEAYSYLVESIATFLTPKQLAELMEDSGFRKITFRRLYAGIIAIHTGWKI